MSVQVVVTKWGDNLVVPIPPDIAARLELAENDRVEIEISRDEHRRGQRRRFRLEDLLAAMTPEREHTHDDGTGLPEV